MKAHIDRGIGLAIYEGMDREFRVAEEDLGESCIRVHIFRTYRILASFVRPHRLEKPDRVAFSYILNIYAQTAESALVFHC